MGSFRRILFSMAALSFAFAVIGCGKAEPTKSTAKKTDPAKGGSTKPADHKDDHKGATKPEEKKPEEKKPEVKAPETKKPEEKKPEAPKKPEEKKPEAPKK